MSKKKTKHKDVLRSEETLRRYRLHKRRVRDNKKDPMAFIEEPALYYFIHWKIVENNFPYDLIAKRHHLLFPVRRVVSEEELNEEELEELKVIKKAIANTTTYDVFFENTPHRRTIPGHMHYHLMAYHYVSKFK